FAGSETPCLGGFVGPVPVAAEQLVVAGCDDRGGDVRRDGHWEPLRLGFCVSHYTPADTVVSNTTMLLHVRRVHRHGSTASRRSNSARASASDSYAQDGFSRVSSMNQRPSASRPRYSTPSPEMWSAL